MRLIKLALELAPNHRTRQQQQQQQRNAKSGRDKNQNHAYLLLYTLLLCCCCVCMLCVPSGRARNRALKPRKIYKGTANVFTCLHVWQSNIEPLYCTATANKYDSIVAGGRWFFRVETGTFRGVISCDIFMGQHVTTQGHRAQPGFSRIVCNNGGQFGIESIICMSC